MAYVNTIRVTSAEHGGEEIVINERDFDAAKHTRVGAEHVQDPADLRPEDVDSAVVEDEAEQGKGRRARK